MQLSNSRTAGNRALKRAYSIVEVLVAVAVFGVMFVSLYTGISAGFAIIQLARENLRATQILQEKLETIRLYTWDQINTPSFVPTNFLDRFYAVDTNDNSSLVYTGAVTIAKAPLSESYSSELRQITVKVSWASGGIAREREMTTLVTRDGLQKYIY